MFSYIFAFSIDSSDMRSTVYRDRSLTVPSYDQQSRFKGQAVSSSKNITWVLAFQKFEFCLKTITMPNTSYLVKSLIVSLFLQPRLMCSEF